MLYEAIIFDLGGVIEKINPSMVTETFKKLGMKDANKFFSIFKQSDVCSLFELGKIQKETFISHIQSICKSSTSTSDIESAWRANQIGISKDTFNALKKIKNHGIKIFLLSNTNTIHAAAIEKNFFNTYKQELSSFFNGIYYSFRIYCRKPDIEAYQHVIQDAKLCAKRCLYIDDVEVNLEAPGKLGMYCIHHKTNNEIGDIKIISALANS